MQEEKKKKKENGMGKLSTDWNDRLKNSSYDLEAGNLVLTTGLKT